MSAEDYHKGKHPAFGRANPELAKTAFWTAMVRSGGTASMAIRKFEGSRDMMMGPVWSYHRHGMSLTPLPDGRYIEIAGEHEDGYDPDFYIYNDVIVHDSRGGCQIYTYPKHIFPPTDFHSATLVGTKIYVIGCLGYRHERRPGFTPVHALDIETFEIAEVPTRGAMPGWIYRHTARLDADEIVITGGKAVTLAEGDQQHTANLQTYRLSLKDRVWRRDMDMEG
ncbi:MAG TPA: hypothetical protein DCL48_09040 [Alphaproteobacteria bacterium]|nr:hypothetical protein [Alphaproteobacteria bacterium]